MKKVIYTPEQQRFILEHYADRGPKWVHERIGVGSYSYLAKWAHKHGVQCPEKTRLKLVREGSLKEDVVKRKSDSIRKSIRKDCIYFKAGLPARRPDYLLQGEDRHTTERRMRLRRYGYIVDFVSFTAYYNEQTNRRPKLEERYTNFTFLKAE